MNLFNKNMQFLKKNATALYNIVSQDEEVFSNSVEVVPHMGNITVETTAGKCYLHSVYDRERENRLLFQSVDSNVQVLFLLGVGLGDALFYISKHYPNLERLIIVEPSISVFRAFLQVNDLGEVVTSFNKLSILLNQPIDKISVFLTDILSTEQYRELAYVCNISYRTLFTDYYNQIYDLLLNKIRTDRVNLNTRYVMQKRWLVNQWRNRQQVAIPIEFLFKNVPAFPAIIVSAGPSLNKNLHLLTQARNKAMIIAVGSAMTILDSHGIVPHLRLAMDASELNESLFSKMDTATTPLLFCDSLYFGILPNYQGKKIRFSLDIDVLGTYFNKLENKTVTSIRSGFSVANVAMDILGKWGCEKIVLMGQDLCFTNNRVHAHGSWDDDITQRIGEIRKQDIYGNDVFTDQPFLGMKSMFEELITQYENCKVINATEGGLAIVGADNKRFAQVLDEDLNEDLQVSARISEALDRCQQDMHPSLSFESIEVAEAELKNIMTLNEENLFALEKVVNLLERRDYKRAAERMNGVERRYDKIRRNNFFKSVLQPLLADKFKAIRLGFRCDDKHFDLKAEKMARVLAGEAVEIREYTQYMKLLMDDFKGTRKLNIIFETS